MNKNNDMNNNMNNDNNNMNMNMNRSKACFFPLPRIVCTDMKVDLLFSYILHMFALYNIVKSDQVQGFL